MLGQCARRLRHYTSEITKVDKRLEAEAAQNEDVKLLASMTGVGIYTTILLAAEISDIAKFEGSKHLVSWAGLSGRQAIGKEDAPWKDKEDGQQRPGKLGNVRGCKRRSQV